MNKEKCWKAELERVNHIADNFGKGVDDGIKEMVVVLNLLGLPTGFSCKGHVDRGYPYPWVLIKVPQYKKKKHVTRKMEDLLDDFYSDVNFSRDHDAVIEIFPQGIYGDFRIQGRGSKIINELPKELLTKKVRGSILHRYQTEMNLFCEFLKQKYFAK